MLQSFLRCLISLRIRSFLFFVLWFLEWHMRNLILLQHWVVHVLSYFIPRQLHTLFYLTNIVCHFLLASLHVNTSRWVFRPYKRRNSGGKLQMILITWTLCVSYHTNWNTFHRNINNILHEIRKRKANWIGHTLRRNCLVKQIIEGKTKGQIEVTRRRGRRRKKLLDDLKDRRGYCQLKEEAIDRTMWRNRFGRGFGTVVWEITDDN